MCSCELSKNSFDIFFTIFLPLFYHFFTKQLSSVEAVISYRRTDLTTRSLPSCRFFCKARLLGFVAFCRILSPCRSSVEIMSCSASTISISTKGDVSEISVKTLTWWLGISLTFLVFSPRIGNILQQAARSSVFDTPHADWWFWKRRWSWNLLRWTRSGRPMSRSLGLPIKCHSMSLIFVDFVDPGIWHCMLAFMTLICASF